MASHSPQWMVSVPLWRQLRSQNGKEQWDFLTSPFGGIQEHFPKPDCLAAPPPTSSRNLNTEPNSEINLALRSNPNHVTQLEEGKTLVFLQEFRLV